jgi:REP element-mobilizing transposase RayT
MMYLEPDGIYHIYNHAVGPENLFRSAENYRYFLERYAYHVQPVVRTYAYCLLPNHFHLLVRVRSRAELIANLNLQGFENLEGLEAKIYRRVSNLFNAYAKAYNKSYARRGALFCHNFKRKPIGSDPELFRVILYIHRNPVHHGFARSLAEWYWSSYRCYIENEPGSLEKDTVLGLFGGKRGFVDAHREYVLDHYRSQIEDLEI